MSDFSSFNTAPQKSSFQAQHLGGSHFGTLQFLTSSGSSFPLLGLPSSVSTYNWTMRANDGQKIIELPEASKLLTQCYKQCQLLYFNLKFLQLIVAEPAYRTSLGNALIWTLLLFYI